MKNNIRERLIELVRQSHCVDVWDYWNDELKQPNPIETLADHLIENGVIVPPCKVGQTVWFIRNKESIETCVEKIILKQGGLYIKLCCNSMYETTCNSIGKTVFLAKSQAEQKLKEMRVDNGNL